MNRYALHALRTAALLGLAATTAAAGEWSAVRAFAEDSAERAGAEGGEGLAIFSGKALTLEAERSVIDDAVLLVRDGRIEAVGSRGSLEIPSGYRRLDLGDGWVMPGMIDLHSHIAGTFDINGAVYQANPGLRVTTSVVPESPNLERAVAAGVTTILFIPGSATNVGGQGVLLKTSEPTFEEMVVREVGSLKIAFADNPARWGYGMRRSMLNWTIRDIVRRGLAYAGRWDRHEAGEGPAPERDIQLDVFRELAAGRTQVSTHTQVHQVVLATIRILKQEYDVPVYIDHGSFDGYRIAALAEAEGVPAILGPRTVSSRSWGRGIDHDGKVEGTAANFQSRGHTTIGFNTDAPVIPQETLPLQAAMSARYGFVDEDLATVRGLTIVPAKTAGIDGRVGSLEVGKDADLVIVSGHPADPRTEVLGVFVQGRLAWQPEEARAW